MCASSATQGTLSRAWPLAVAALGILLLESDSPLLSDVIHLKDGSILVVERAWEEDDQIRYQTSDGIKAIPKSSTYRIQQEKRGSEGGFPGRKYGFAQVEGPNTVDLGRGDSLSIAPTNTSKDLSEEVVRRLTENVRSNPDDTRSKHQLISALNSLASLQLLRGDASAAKASLHQALSHDKRNPTTLANLAIVHLQSGEFRSAEELLLDLARVDSGNAYVRYLLGEAYYAQDKISEAIREWKAGLDFGPDPRISTRLEKAEQELTAHRELGVLQSAHFILRYDRQVSDYRLGQEILDTLERVYRRLTFELTSEPPATVTVILYPDQIYFDVTRAPNWSGAIFDGKIRIPIKGLSSVTPELETVLTHELTHSFVASSQRMCPTWFNEGVAQFQEGKSASTHAKALAELELQKRLIPLSDLKGSFAGLPQEISGLAYLEGLSAVEYLVNKHGSQVLRNLLMLMRQGQDFETALRSLTNRNLAQFEQAWLASLKSQ